MEWWGYLFWALIAYLSTVTTQEKVPGSNVTVPVKKYKLFVWMDKARIAMLGLIVVIMLPTSLWGLLTWAWDFAKSFHWWLR